MTALIATAAVALAGTPEVREVAFQAEVLRMKRQITEMQVFLRHARQRVQEIDEFLKTIRRQTGLDD